MKRGLVELGHNTIESDYYALDTETHRTLGLRREEKSHRLRIQASFVV